MGISSPLVDLQHQYDLLQKEYEYEKETYRQQSERTGLRKRVAQGLCWYPVTPGRSYYNSLNQLVIEIERTEDREIEHNFEYGRPVCFFTADISGKFKYLDFSATISYVQEDRIPGSAERRDRPSNRTDFIRRNRRIFLFTIDLGNTEKVNTGFLQYNF